MQAELRAKAMRMTRPDELNTISTVESGFDDLLHDGVYDFLCLGSFTFLVFHVSKELQTA